MPLARLKRHVEEEPVLPVHLGDSDEHHDHQAQRPQSSQLRDAGLEPSADLMEAKRLR